MARRIRIDNERRGPNRDETEIKEDLPPSRLEIPMPPVEPPKDDPPESQGGSSEDD